jgi:signal peptidase I
MLALTPPSKDTFIKRVIAVGGQTIACCDDKNRVVVDGRPLEEHYIYYMPEAGPPRQSEFGPIQIPPGQLWVMGDNRNDSADSRSLDHFGPIPSASVIGKAQLVILPPSRLQHIPDYNPQVSQ